MTLLNDYRVLDLSSGIPGAYATKVLVDAGADVVLVEPAAGDRLRRWTASGAEPGPEGGALFGYLAAGKRSVVAEPGSPRWAELLAGADLLVESGLLDDAALAAVRATRPDLDVLSITAFGRTGPWAGRPATDFTLQALSGSTGGRGHADRPPVPAGGRLGEWITGSFAAATALALRTGARRRGEGGEHADLSALECLCVAMALYAPLTAGLAGTRALGRTVEIPSIERTQEGWIGFCTVTGQMFRDFLVMIDRADLLDEPSIVDPKRRQGRYREFQQMIEQWTATLPDDAIEELATAFRIPVSPLGTPATVTANAHFRERGVFVKGAGGVLQPRRPYLVDGDAGAGPGPVPAVGAHTAEVSWSRRERRPNPASGRPLADLRIVDLTGFWAGPSATAVLAAFGADVVKVESTGRPDGMRFHSTKPPSVDGWWEWGGVYQGANAGKRGVTLDLSRPEGRTLLDGLLADADVLIENFSPRVLGNFGLTWETLHERFPRLSLVRMPAFGLDGPWRDRTGFAQTMEQASGLSWMTGHPDGPPLVLKGPCDPIAGLHAVIATLGALEHAEGTGSGVHVEVPMVESTLNVGAEPVLEYGAYGAESSRTGTRGPEAAPQGLYPARPRPDTLEEWLALAVVTDEHWAALRQVLGEPEWAAVPELRTAAGRRAAHDALDAHLAAWAADRDAAEAAEALTAAGVPAARVVPPPDVLDNPQIAARGFTEYLDHPVAGTQPLPAMPVRFASRPGPWFDRPAPTLGQHNDEVLGALPGVDPERLAELRALRVIGERPDNL